MDDLEDLEPIEPKMTGRLGNLTKFADVVLNPDHVIMVLSDKVLLDNNKMYTIGSEAAEALRWALPSFSAPAGGKPLQGAPQGQKTPQKPSQEAKTSSRKYERVTEKDAQLWADLYNRGFRYSEIARKVGRNVSTIQRTIAKMTKPKDRFLSPSHAPNSEELLSSPQTLTPTFTPNSEELISGGI